MVDWSVVVLGKAKEGEGGREVVHGVIKSLAVHCEGSKGGREMI